MFRYFKKALCLLSILVFVVNVYPQNDKSLSLEECIDLALKNNSQLKNATYMVDRSGATVRGSYSSVLPRITASFQSGRFIQSDRSFLGDVPVRYDSVTNKTFYEQQEITQDGSARNSHSTRISYSQNLFDFGRSWNSIKQAKAAFDASGQSLTSTRYAVYALVKRRYFELLRAIKLEQEYQLAVERSKEQLNRTQSMYEIGSVALVDVYRSEVTLGNDEINLITQQNVDLIARGNLNVAMGRDPETPLEILDISTPTSPSKYSLEEALGIAEKNNPDLKRFTMEMKSAEYGRKIAKAAYMPSLGFSVTYSRSNEQLNRVYGGIDKNFSISMGASVDFNIFNGLADAAEVSRQSANYSIAQENRLDSRRQMELIVKQAFLNLNAYDNISRINERNLRASEEEYRLAQERYRVGAGTQLEVTEAQVSLTRARVILVSTKYNSLISQAELEAAMGIVEAN